MRIRVSIVALAAMTTFAVPSLLHAQKPTPAGPGSQAALLSPARLLSQREELRLTPQQVSDLSLLTAQVRRYQRAVLIAPSKPWIASTRGTTEAEASARAFSLLSSDQRELALQGGEKGVELASVAPDVPGAE